MRRKNMDTSVSAILYIKSKLLLNGFKDLSIKDMLRQMGLDIDKPFKVSFDKNDGTSCLWLRYETEDRKVVFKFNEIRQKQDNEKILTIETLEEGVWERFGIFHNCSKDNISKIFIVRRKDVVLSLKDEFVNIEDVADFDGKIISIEEYMHAGIDGPYQILLRTRLFHSQARENSINIKDGLYLDFVISNWDKDSFYNLNNKSDDKFKKFLKKLYYYYSNGPISIIDMYQEICDIYGLQMEKLQDKYQITLHISNSSNENKNQYKLDEKEGVIKVCENGIVYKYVREVNNRFVGLRRIKGSRRAKS